MKRQIIGNFILLVANAEKIVRRNQCNLVIICYRHLLFDIVNIDLFCSCWNDAQTIFSPQSQENNINILLIINKQIFGKSFCIIQSFVYVILYKRVTYINVRHYFYFLVIHVSTIVQP